MFTLEQGKKLVELARHAIETHFERKTLSLESYKEFSEKQGVFVTLKKHGELKGCIGFTEPIMVLYQAVVRAARAAAFEDTRFKPLKKEEFNEIEIEISVLTKPELIRVSRPEEYFKKIVVGRDGLIIKAGVYSGLLLPQVPLEYNWDVEKYLRQLCMKAGVPMDAWKNYPIHKFQAQIFAEEDGKVVQK
jgi:uncharacterized protein (TIGR00296 family)